MATNLGDHVEWFKREVAVPGTFGTLFPDTTDDDLSGALVDGLYRAKLDGWLASYEGDPDTFDVTPDLTMTAVGVVIVYSAIRFVQNEIKNMATRTTYKAPGGLEATTEHAASVLTQRLKDLQEERKQLLDVARRRGGTTVYMYDGYAIRANAFYRLELPSFGGTIPAELVG